MTSRPLAHRFDFAKDHGERVVDVEHEDAAHDVDHTDRAAVRRARQVAAVARDAGGVVGRPEEPRLDADVVERFFLVPDVVAGRHHVDAPSQELIADLAGDAEAGRRVFGVGDDDVDLMVVDERGQTALDELASRPPDDVADEENPRHMAGFPPPTGT